MKETHPELFVHGPNGTYPSNEELWNESKKQFEEAFERHQKEGLAGRPKELAERARTLNIENGLYDATVNPFTPMALFPGA